MCSGKIWFLVSSAAKMNMLQNCITAFNASFMSKFLMCMCTLQPIDNIYRFILRLFLSVQKVNEIKAQRNSLSMRSASRPFWACLSLFTATRNSMINCRVLTSGLATSTSISGLLIWFTKPSAVTDGRYLQNTHVNVTGHARFCLQECQDTVSHLPRVCPFQQRSSLVTSAALRSSLQMVCGSATQNPLMGRRRSCSSSTWSQPFITYQYQYNTGQHTVQWGRETLNVRKYPTN